MNWTKSGDFVSWLVRLTALTTFDVTIAYDADGASAGGTYAVALGAQTLTGTVSQSKGQAQPLVRVHLAPGTFEIHVTPTQIKGGELMRLRSLTLTPVGG